MRTVKSELKVLQRLQGCNPVCTLIDSGSENGLHFFVMQLLGRNLAETIQRDYGGSAPLTDVKVLATGLLNALEGFHKEGFIHRDVKPANFALEASTVSPIDGLWKLIDFGLARQYIDEKKEILPARKDAGFRGSTTYASLNAHKDEDLGRRDDIWSWFYMVVEMIEGTLPWRVEKGGAGGGGDADAATETPGVAAAGPGNGNQTAKESVEEKKKECKTHPERLFSKVLPMPPVMKEINDHIAKLEFGDAPNYSYLRTLLGRLDAPLGNGVEAEAGKVQEIEKPISALLPTLHQQVGHPIQSNTNINNNNQTLENNTTGNGLVKGRAPLVVEQSRHRSKSLERKKDTKRSDRRDRKERSRDREKDRSRRSWSHSRSRSRSRTRSRSRSPGGGRDRSRRRSRSRSPSRDRRRNRRDRSYSRSRSPRSRSRSPHRDNKKRRSGGGGGGSDRKNNTGAKSSDVVLVNAQKKFQNSMEFVGMLRSVSY